MDMNQMLQTPTLVARAVDKGVWRIEHITVSGDARCVATVTPAPDAADVARILAAAPRMLAMLCECLYVLGDPSKTAAMADKVGHVIAQAIGDAPME